MSALPPKADSCSALAHVRLARCGHWGEAGKRDALLAKAAEHPGLCFIFHPGPAGRDRDGSVSGSLLLVTLVVFVALVVIILALVVVLIHIVLVDGDAACSAAANACPNSRCITAGPHHANWSDLRIEDQVALGVVLLIRLRPASLIFDDFV